MENKALECLQNLRLFQCGACEHHHCTKCSVFKNYEVVRQALTQAQELEKENELLKEIIKSLFDRGCPLHQYTDSKGVLQIEVDDECSNMRLGEFKGVDLDKKLKEVL